MSDNKTLGKKIIEAAGGAENIKSITNCATRLRMYIKDASKYDEESIKKIDGVMGTSIVGDQYQVIVGPKAIHLCKAIQDEYGIAGAGKKQEKAKGNIVNRFLETVSGCTRAVCDYNTAYESGYCSLKLCETVEWTAA